ncbi:uncharacterized protein LOC114747123 isoform X2 [Neltuma alba]|uniref:uncharacterized protein LOC114747123 isoform X2 n=1 Tax=Neltuma alba TaxID=207710 RepID=UPI0010A2FDB1|nr:uncharacterized protein LOC114747123 isoform X2 [Prosopis alba]
MTIFAGNITERTKARRMMGKPENDAKIRIRTKVEAALRIVAAEEMAPSPAPSPSLPSYSYHDQRNNTDGLKLLSPKTQVEQTGID